MGPAQARLRWLHAEPNVLKKEDLNEGKPFKASAPDVEGCVEFLVKEKNFNEEHIRKALKKVEESAGKAKQGRLESFFGAATIHKSTIGVKRKVGGKAVHHPRRCLPSCSATPACSPLKRRLTAVGRASGVAGGGEGQGQGQGGRQKEDDGGCRQEEVSVWGALRAEAGWLAEGSGRCCHHLQRSTALPFSPCIRADAAALVESAPISAIEPCMKTTMNLYKSAPCFSAILRAWSGGARCSPRTRWLRLRHPG